MILDPEQCDRFDNLLSLARGCVLWGKNEADLKRGEDYTAQALMLLRIEIKAAEKPS